MILIPKGATFFFSNCAYNIEHFFGFLDDNQVWFRFWSKNSENLWDFVQILWVFWPKFMRFWTKVWVDKTQILTRLPQAYIQVFMVGLSKVLKKWQFWEVFCLYLLGNYSNLYKNWAQSLPLVFFHSSKRWILGEVWEIRCR